MTRHVRTLLSVLALFALPAAGADECTTAVVGPRRGRGRPAAPLEEPRHGRPLEPRRLREGDALQLPGARRPRGALRAQRLRRRQLRGLRRHELGGLQPPEEDGGVRGPRGHPDGGRPPDLPHRRRLRGVPEGQPRPRPGRPRELRRDRRRRGGGDLRGPQPRLRAARRRRGARELPRQHELVPHRPGGEGRRLRAVRSRHRAPEGRPRGPSRLATSCAAWRATPATRSRPSRPRRLRRAPGRPGPVGLHAGLDQQVLHRRPPS